MLAPVTFGQQKVGVVLSGGGATGLAHVGVLMALEEHNIPIDYITGTSAGALVGSLYASGYSPEEIKAYVLSDDFQLMANGELRRQQHFLFREEDPNARMISLSFSKDSIFKKVLPTNFNSSAFLDFEMMRLLGTTSASVNYDFDNLFVPFRCVASDIAEKKSVIFRDGHLNAAVRASMTYPFFFKPTRVDGKLLFDGGLYNNFPADIMYNDFSPDFIIGSNVSYNADPPTEDDLISQITNMLVRHSNFELPCEEGFIIEPQTEVTTFDFNDVEQAILDGYNSTISQIDSLKSKISRRTDRKEIQRKRAVFREKLIPLVVTSVSTKTGKKELRYTRLSIIKSKKPEHLSVKELEKRYFRLYAAPQVGFIMPMAELKADSSYNIALKVRKSKDFKIDVGGHVSSRPVNTGYLGLTYQTIGKVITRTHLESYFGKFYGSAKADFTLEFPAVYPISTTAYFTLNRWDYFQSFATFFEDVQPSFLVQDEMYGGIKINFPFGNTIKSTFDVRGFQLEDRYYQTDQFSNKDTADVTGFRGFTSSISFLQNSLNRKQFASGGHLFSFNARYVLGEEHSTPGSTSISDLEIIKQHSWVNLGLEYQTFIVDLPFFHLGLHGQAQYSTQKFFANYTATLLSMNDFSLVPDAKTTFLPEYRTSQYLAAGLNTVFTIRKNFDIRADGYFFQPIVQLSQMEGGIQHFSDPFKGGRSIMASGSIIYHSFLGPVRATLNYYPNQLNPLSFQFSFGYVLFNERAIR